MPGANTLAYYEHLEINDTLFSQSYH